MAEANAAKQEPIRLLFELDREDDPRLYDDLIRFNKGTKRINRLRLLAHEGVVGQFAPDVGKAMVPSLPELTVPDDVALPSALHAPSTADVFAQPITDHGAETQEHPHG